MFSISAPSHTLLALCACATETDLLKMRRLGRSVARCVDLFWACGGQYRAFGPRVCGEIRTLRSLELPARGDGEPAKPFGLLAFIDVIDDAVGSGYLPFESLVLLARRTMQHDTLVLLYLLVYAIVTNSAGLAEQLIDLGESWAERETSSDATSPRKQPQQPGAAAGTKGPAIDREDDDIDAALQFMAEHIEAAQDEDNEADEADVTVAADDPEQCVSWQETIMPHLTLDMFHLWWPQLATRSRRGLLQSYFDYLYPRRTKLKIDVTEGIDELTLAEQLVLIGAMWSSTTVLRVMMRVPAIRRNVSTSVFLIITAHMTDVLSSTAHLLETVERQANLLVPAGIERLHDAVAHPCVSIGVHFERLANDSLFCEAIEKFVNPATRDDMRPRHTDCLRPYLRTTNTAETTTEQAPPQNNSFAISPIDIVDYVSVFWHACARDDLALVRALIVDTKVAGGESNSYAVRHAAAHDASKVLAYLLALPCVDAAAEDGLALCWAVERSSVRSVELLLQKSGVRTDVNFHFPLCRASEKNNIDIVRLLVARDKIDVNARDSTPFLNALRHANLEMIALLATRKEFNLRPRADGRFEAAAAHLREQLAKCGDVTTRVEGAPIFTENTPQRAEEDEVRAMIAQRNAAKLSDTKACLALLSAILSKESV